MEIMKTASLILLLFFLVLSCGPFRKAQRVDTERTETSEAVSQPAPVAEQKKGPEQTDVGRLARDMMTECLSRAWIPAYLGVTGDKPVVTVGPIQDWTGEGIDTEAIATGCEQEFSKSEQVSFAACQSRSEEPGEEGADEQEFVSPETIKRIKSENGATFILVGAIRSTGDKTAAGSSPYFQIELEMINTKTLARVWSGSGKIGE
jgi:hypothetical protein